MLLYLGVAIKLGDRPMEIPPEDTDFFILDEDNEMILDEESEGVYYE